MSKDSRVYLAHILECLEKIERFTAGGGEAFLADELVQDAVLRNFEVIGEAAKRLDDAYRAAHPEIPWRALAGLRDVLIHHYEGVDLERVWAIVEKDLPGLKRAIAALLPPLDQLERELAGEDGPSEEG
ncbi:MAG: HepT-like ribonuclease domain-containing protein [Planctomycetota bacterium]